MIDKETMLLEDGLRQAEDCPGKSTEEIKGPTESLAKAAHSDL
jgi:hypothetical protein